MNALFSLFFKSFLPLFPPSLPPLSSFPLFFLFLVFFPFFLLFLFFFFFFFFSLTFLSFLTADIPTPIIRRLRQHSPKHTLTLSSFFFTSYTLAHTLDPHSCPRYTLSFAHIHTRISYIHSFISPLSLFFLLFLPPLHFITYLQSTPLPISSRYQKNPLIHTAFTNNNNKDRLSSPILTYSRRTIGQKIQTRKKLSRSTILQSRVSSNHTTFDSLTPRVACSPCTKYHHTLFSAPNSNSRLYISLSPFICGSRDIIVLQRQGNRRRERNNNKEKVFVLLCERTVTVGVWGHSGTARQRDRDRDIRQGPAM